jgi:hypothetical protein
MSWTTCENVRSAGAAFQEPGQRELGAIGHSFVVEVADDQ